MSEINLGIIGGGQLGSMLSMAAKKLDIKSIIYCDDINAPAQNFCDEFIFGNYNEIEKILEFANKANIITYEFENIPYTTLNEISKKKPVLPDPNVNKIIQHRLAEKDFINKLSIKTTQYSSVEKKSDLDSLGSLLPGILKTTTMGYDNYEIYEPIENTHEDQILKYSKIPADVSEKIFNESKDWAIKIAEELKYVGTLCVEFFIDKNENLYVNEIAPRVHNSGHLTINAFNVSQFENHIRAVCSLKIK